MSRCILLCLILGNSGKNVIFVIIRTEFRYNSTLLFATTKNLMGIFSPSRI